MYQTDSSCIHGAIGLLACINKGGVSSLQLARRVLAGFPIWVMLRSMARPDVACTPSLIRGSLLPMTGGDCSVCFICSRFI